MNDFSGNDILLYRTFPHLFFFGSGLEGNGTLSDRQVRHLLFQFGGQFAKCSRLIFLLFDQKQRHASARIIASRIKSHPQSLDIFKLWASDSNKIVQLEEAIQNPGTKSANNLLREIEPHIKTCAAKIPYSDGERAGSMVNALALTYFFGMPSNFITFAPDDIRGPLNLRMSLPFTNNQSFPSDGTGFEKALKDGKQNFNGINLSKSSLPILLANAPVEAAEIFRLVTNAVYTHLLGTPPEKNVRKTKPIADRCHSAFGIPRASFGPSEEQARGSLHTHILHWNAITPLLLQYASEIPQLVGDAINKMMCAKLDIATHVRQLLDELDGITSTVQTPFLSRNPLREPQAFNSDVQNNVSRFNMHAHTITCHKLPQGKEHCRVARPQDTVEITKPIQITSREATAENKKSYVVLPSILPSDINCLHNRNKSLFPIAVRDKRSIIWELLRPMFHPLATLKSPLLNIPMSILPYNLIERFDGLSFEDQNLLNNRLVNRNGIVVEYSPIMAISKAADSEATVVDLGEQDVTVSITIQWSLL
jgi:hypothetical protein